MSGRRNSDNVETLFSFELLVDCIRIRNDSKVSDELALGVRLLDFPTLLIYQPQQSSGVINQQQEPHGTHQQGEYAFNRGKSCFFKMQLSSLHTQLFNSPLYAMVLDVKEEVPKLVGTSLISLAKVMDRIRQDVSEHGASTPSSHGERVLVGICNLTGEKIGSISLSYKLLSLGTSLLPHITDSRVAKSTSLHGERATVVDENASLPLECEIVCSPTGEEPGTSRNVADNRPSDWKSLINEDEQDNSCVAKPTEHKPRSQMPLDEPQNSFDDELTAFCPPRLYYSNSAKQKCTGEAADCKSPILDTEAFPFDDTYSEDETAGNEMKVTHSPVMNQRAGHDIKTSSNKQTSGLNPNVFGEALQQLPLLNALLVELSQLNGPNSQQPLSIHPNLAWIYRPASPGPSAVCGDLAQKTQTKSLQKNRPGTSPNLKRFHSPRNCSTPVAMCASAKAKGKQEEPLIESKGVSGVSRRKKLVYGTTKTFNLRLKQISPLGVKRRECVESIDTQSGVAKGKTKSCKKSSKIKATLIQNSSLNENIETMIQSITVAPQGTITLKRNNLPEKACAKQDTRSQGISGKPSLSERGLKVINIPSVYGDSIAPNKDNNEHHSESYQSQSESDRHRDRTESPRSSRSSSPKSSFSDSSVGGNEEADYADDFDSLEPSEGFSPDPASSPELSRAKAARSPVRLELLNSGSEDFQRRPVLPVPVKAPSSPRRALRGTHVIRPRPHTSALSFSSNDSDGSASLQTMRSRKQTESGKRSTDADTLIASRGQSCDSTRNSGPVRGFSAESLSSTEPQEAEELEDELGSLDFRKEYQHISKLVTNKLPGYTM